MLESPVPLSTWHLHCDIRDSSHPAHPPLTLRCPPKPDPTRTFPTAADGNPVLLGIQAQIPELLWSPLSPTTGSPTFKMYFKSAHFSPPLPSWSRPEPCSRSSKSLQTPPPRGHYFCVLLPRLFSAQESHPVIPFLHTKLCRGLGGKPKSLKGAQMPQMIFPQPQPQP